MKKVQTKFRVGNRMIPVVLEYRPDERIRLHFRFNRKLLEIVKTSFEGRKWLGPPINANGPKLWEIPITQRNDFVLKYLQARTLGDSPYAPYENAVSEACIKQRVQEVSSYFKDRYGDNEHLYQHQKEMVAHALMTNSFIWAAEMGTGKTLAAFIWMEMSKVRDWIWVAPKSALRACMEEIDRWLPQVNPVLMSYDELKKYEARGLAVPHGMILDESPKIKTPVAQRSIAARNIANLMRENGDEHIGLLSGAPAPRSPLDWWHQCEVACPGFLREASIFLFRERMGIYEDANDGAYKKHVTWRDTEEKCEKCGELKSAEIHNFAKLKNGYHEFVEGVDEVSFLHKRMRGLVLVKLKKDCLDLPDKVYIQRHLKPTVDIINAARLIAKTSTRVIDALTRLRMLSDGFQYVEKQTGETVCPLCAGKQTYYEFYNPKEPDEYVPEDWANQGIDGDGNQIDYQKRECPCPNCNATGRVPKYTRTAEIVECPKDTALIEDLEAHEDVGRLNIYAGFTASVDRVVALCQKQGWTTIRADGRGWEGKTPHGEILENDKLLKLYQEGQDLYPRIAFIGQPGAAGEGLTLTASPTTVFWSNDFNGNSRLQAEDRGHRIGMDKERGGRIVDYLHLDSDAYVLDNLQKKKDLQKQSMTGLRKVFNVNT